MKLTRKRKASPARYYVCFAGDRRWMRHRYASPADGTCVRCGTLRPYRGIRR